MATATGQSDIERVRGAMRSCEWLRTQWIARVAFELGSEPWQPGDGRRTLAALRRLEADGRAERRDAVQVREGEIAGATVRFTIPRSEWRLIAGGGGR